jgi:hypothetical protein
VTVRDERTGKGGLLWEEGKTTTREVQNPPPVFEEQLPVGAKEVISHMSTMVGARGENLECWTNFFVCPEADQEGVAEEDGLYHVAMGEDNSEGDEYPFSFIIGSTDTAKVGSFIRSSC